MTPVSPVQVNVKPENSCNNWKCCFGWRCGKKEQEDSPVSVEIIEKVTRTFERHHHSHSSSPVISSSPVPRLAAPPPLLRIGAIDLPKHLKSASMAELNEERKENSNEN
jgi:hypothetical protein